MAILLETEAQLQELKIQLEKSGARGLKMLKHVEFHLKTENKGQEFIVNRWPDPTVVLQKTTKHQLSSFLRGSCLVYTTTIGGSEELNALFDHDVLDWSEAWTFAGMARDLYEPVANIAMRNGKQIEPAEEMIVANTLVLNQSVQERTLPEGYYCSGPLKSESDINKVNSSWKFGGNDACQDFIKLSVENMHSCGVRDKDGNLIAFELQTSYGSVAMLHVDPEHRNKGVGKYVMAKLAQALQDDGQTVFCHIEKVNELSFKLHTQFGYEMAEGGTVVWARCYPKSGEKCVKNKACCM